MVLGARHTKYAFPVCPSALPVSSLAQMQRLKMAWYHMQLPISLQTSVATVPTPLPPETGLAAFSCASCFADKSLEIGPESLHVQASHFGQIVIDHLVIHSHAPQFIISQPREIFLASFGVDGLLQVGRFAQHQSGLPILSIERLRGRDDPAQCGEVLDH